MKQIIKAIERYSVKDVPFISVMFETTSTGKQTTNNYFVIDGCYERNLFGVLVHTRIGHEVDLQFDILTGRLSGIKNFSLGIEANYKGNSAPAKNMVEI